VLAEKPDPATTHESAIDELTRDLIGHIRPPVNLQPGPWPLTGDDVGIGDDVHRALLADDWADSRTKANQLRKLIEVQVVARKRQHSGDHPGARDIGISVDGGIVGRILLDLDDDTVDARLAAVSVVDIAVHPERQRRGIGSEVLRALLAAAADEQRPVQLSAVFGTSAIRWFQGAGFADTGGDALYRTLVWRP